MGLIDKENKDKRSAIITVVAISLIIFIFLWRFVFTHVETEFIAPPQIKVAPNIDFDYLEEKEFTFFEEYKPITSLSEEFMGRENPFLPY